MSGSISGQVVNIRNTYPVEGATIAVTPGTDTTTANQNGVFSITRDAGTYAVQVTASGFEPWHAHDVVVLDNVDTNLYSLALWPADD